MVTTLVGHDEEWTPIMVRWHRPAQSSRSVAQLRPCFFPAFPLWALCLCGETAFLGGGSSVLLAPAKVQACALSLFPRPFHPAAFLCIRHGSSLALRALVSASLRVLGGETAFPAPPRPPTPSRALAHRPRLGPCRPRAHRTTSAGPSTPAVEPSTARADLSTAGVE